jgi:hypothetical protein
MSLSTRLSIAIASTALFALACTAKTDKSADTSAVDTSATTVTDVDIAPLDSGPLPQPSWTVTEHGIGPLLTGMTVAQAKSAVGGGFAAPRGYSGGCGYAVLVKGPSGLAVMLEDGKIARVEVRSGGIATGEGARIGDSESRIKSLYAGRVTSTPHKYVTGGHYLTVTPSAPADSAYRIVFETDGSKVTEYRSGRTPAVEQVERCG